MIFAKRANAFAVGSGPSELPPEGTESLLHGSDLFPGFSLRQKQGRRVSEPCARLTAITD
jgi:hypothetical protein